MAKTKSAKIRTVRTHVHGIASEPDLVAAHALHPDGRRWELWELINGQRVLHEENYSPSSLKLKPALSPIVDRLLSTDHMTMPPNYAWIRGALDSEERFYVLAQDRLWRQVDPPSDEELASILRVVPPPDLSVLVAEISKHVAAEESLPHALRLRVLQWREMFRERTPSAALILDPFRKAPGYPTTDASLLGCLRLALAMLPMYFERDSTIWPPKDPSQTSDVLARAGVICDMSPSTLLASTKPAAVLSGAIGTVIERRRLDDSLHRPEEFQLLKVIYPTLREIAGEEWAQDSGSGTLPLEFPCIQSESVGTAPLPAVINQLVRQHASWWRDLHAKLNPGLKGQGDKRPWNAKSRLKESVAALSEKGLNERITRRELKEHFGVPMQRSCRWGNAGSHGAKSSARGDYDFSRMRIREHFESLLKSLKGGGSEDRTPPGRSRKK